MADPITPAQNMPKRVSQIIEDLIPNAGHSIFFYFSGPGYDLELT
jgi:hypothetical protein